MSKIINYIYHQYIQKTDRLFNFDLNPLQPGGKDRITIIEYLSLYKYKLRQIPMFFRKYSVKA